ncbi:TPA: hypothetical protein ACH3X3_005103 [Trebouxia sp. C0006]
MQSNPDQLEHSSAGRLSLFLSRQESLAAPATKQVQGTPFVWRHWTNSRPANKFRIYRCCCQARHSISGLHGQQQDELPPDLRNGLTLIDQPPLLGTNDFNCPKDMAFALPLLANGISGDTSYVQLLDDFNSSGGLGVPDGCFVSSNCCVLRRPSSPTVVEKLGVCRQHVMLVMVGMQLSRWYPLLPRQA